MFKQVDFIHFMKADDTGTYTSADNIGSYWHL